MAVRVLFVVGSGLYVGLRFCEREAFCHWESILLGEHTECDGGSILCYGTYHTECEEDSSSFFFFLLLPYCPAPFPFSTTLIWVFCLVQRLMCTSELGILLSRRDQGWETGSTILVADTSPPPHCHASLYSPCPLNPSHIRNSHWYVSIFLSVFATTEEWIAESSNPQLPPQGKRHAPVLLSSSYLRRWYLSSGPPS
jgi:hypothetical protein